MGKIIWRGGNVLILGYFVIRLILSFVSDKKGRTFLKLGVKSKGSNNNKVVINTQTSHYSLLLICEFSDIFWDSWDFRKFPKFSQHAFHFDVFIWCQGIAEQSILWSLWSVHIVSKWYCAYFELVTTRHYQAMMLSFSNESM